MAAAVLNTETDSLSLAKAKARLRIYINYEEDPDWKNRAVRCYHRLLELIEEGTSGPNGVLELEKAVIANELAAKAKCILITLNSIGPYFQVLKQKYRPEVVSCKLWRSPNLLPTTKIQPIAEYYTEDKLNPHITLSNCQGQSVCVNPYHYNCSDSIVGPDAVRKRNIKLRLLEQKKDGGDQAWKDQSIDCMLKVFDFAEKTDSRGLSELNTAIENRAAETGCILMAASAGIELEYWPHFASYRLWRCPEVLCNLIQPIEKYGGNEDNCHVKETDKEYENVCINPFHYTIKKIGCQEGQTGSEVERRAQMARY